MTSSESTNSVFNLTAKNSIFSITTPGYWSSRGVAETFYKLQKLLGLRSENDIELHVKEVRKKGNEKKIQDNKCKLSELDTHKNEIIEE